jgi:hypothetical protein
MMMASHILLSKFTFENVVSKIKTRKDLKWLTVI